MPLLAQSYSARKFAPEVVAAIDAVPGTIGDRLREVADMAGSLAVGSDYAARRIALGIVAQMANALLVMGTVAAFIPADNLLDAMHRDSPLMARLPLRSVLQAIRAEAGADGWNSEG